MRRIVLTAAVALVAAGLAGSASAALKLARKAGGFASPVYATGAPGGRADLFVVEQAGRIVRIYDGKRNTFLDIDGRVRSGGEQGLLSIAFHPALSRRTGASSSTTRTTRAISGSSVPGERRGGRGRSSRRPRSGLACRIPTTIRTTTVASSSSGRTVSSTRRSGDGGDGGDRARELGTRLGKLLGIERRQSGSRGADRRSRISAIRGASPSTEDTGRFFVGDVGQEHVGGDRRLRAGPKTGSRTTAGTASRATTASRRTRSGRAAT